jgi:hypothetical protein
MLSKSLLSALIVTVATAGCVSQGNLRPPAEPMKGAQRLMLPPVHPDMDAAKRQLSGLFDLLRPARRHSVTTSTATSTSVLSRLQLVFKGGDDTEAALKFEALVRDECPQIVGVEPGPPTGDESRRWFVRGNVSAQEFKNLIELAIERGEAGFVQGTAVVSLPFRKRDVQINAIPPSDGGVEVIVARSRKEVRNESTSAGSGVMQTGNRSAQSAGPSNSKPAATLASATLNPRANDERLTAADFAWLGAILSGGVGSLFLLVRLAMKLTRLLLRLLVARSSVETC